jgi:hypothetical protein
MGQKTTRLTAPIQERLGAEARRRGLLSTFALIRVAIENEAEDRQATLDAMEQWIAGNTGDGWDGGSTCGHGATLAVRFSRCPCTGDFALPSGTPSGRSFAGVSQCQQRHNKLLRAAALSMRGDARTVLANLVSHGE